VSEGCRGFEELEEWCRGFNCTDLLACPLTLPRLLLPVLLVLWCCRSGRRHRKLELAQGGLAAPALASPKQNPAAAKGIEEKQQRRREQLELRQGQQQQQATLALAATAAAAEEALLKLQQKQQKQQQQQQEKQQMLEAEAQEKEEGELEEEPEQQQEAAGGSAHAQRRRRSPYHQAVAGCRDLACLGRAAKLPRHAGQFRFPHFLILGWQVGRVCVWVGRVGRQCPQDVGRLCLHASA
jgi:flagellar motor protein MotB